MHHEQEILRYGFLFKGYKQRTYYWEAVVMLRKVAMIFIAVFLRSAGTRIQAFVIFIFLLFFVILTEEKKPYLIRKLNTLELISLVTSCVTIYSGFFFLSASDPTSVSFDYNKDCKLSNNPSFSYTCMEMDLLSSHSPLQPLLLTLLELQSDRLSAWTL